MGIRKNEASQKVGFVMVDKTDFATPETGISPTGVLRKDGGASATLSNTVSELSSGEYVVTLATAETNANLLQLRFHDSGASCADQHLTFYPDPDLSSISLLTSGFDSAIAGPLASILIDTAAILVDTSDLSNIKTICSDIESNLSDVSNTLVSLIAGPIASILVDTNATLDNKIDSILVDTGTTIISDITAVYSALSDFEAQASTDVTAIKSDITAVYSALSDFEATNATTLTTVTSDITAVYSALSDFEAAVVDNITSVIDDTSKILSTLDGPIASQLSSIEVVTDVLVSDIAAVLSTLDGPVISTMDGPLLSTLDKVATVTDALTAAAATKIAISAGTIVAGTVSWDNTNATTTVIYCNDIIEATADHYNGRIMIFTSGALQYQATDITDYALDTGEGKFTVTALTEAPADNVTFIIV